MAHPTLIKARLKCLSWDRWDWEHRWPLYILPFAVSLVTCFDSGTVTEVLMLQFQDEASRDPVSPSNLSFQALSPHKNTPGLVARKERPSRIKWMVPAEATTLEWPVDLVADSRGLWRSSPNPVRPELPS